MTQKEMDIEIIIQNDINVTFISDSIAKITSSACGTNRKLLR